jgi:hypothetical protein
MGHLTLRVLVFAPLLVAGMSGCYDGKALIARALQRVAEDHRAEIELGAYEITLPRQHDNPVATTLQLTVVATVDREDVRKIKKQLAAVETLLRHKTLFALRRCSREELLESSLQSLHNRVAELTRDYLTTAPIESIAFKTFTVYEE